MIDSHHLSSSIMMRLFHHEYLCDIIDWMNNLVIYSCLRIYRCPLAASAFYFLIVTDIHLKPFQFIFHFLKCWSSYRIILIDYLFDYRHLISRWMIKGSNQIDFPHNELITAPCFWVICPYVQAKSFPSND